MLKSMSVEMSVARWRALTLLWESGQASAALEVEMSVARWRALTQEATGGVSQWCPVEMSVARLRAPLHTHLAQTNLKKRSRPCKSASLFIFNKTVRTERGQQRFQARSLPSQSARKIDECMDKCYNLR